MFPSISRKFYHIASLFATLKRKISHWDRVFLAGFSKIYQKNPVPMAEKKETFRASSK